MEQIQQDDIYNFAEFQQYDIVKLAMGNMYRAQITNIHKNGNMDLTFEKNNSLSGTYTPIKLMEFFIEKVSLVFEDFDIGDTVLCLHENTWVKGSILDINVAWNVLIIRHYTTDHIYEYNVDDLSLIRPVY